MKSLLQLISPPRCMTCNTPTSGQRLCEACEASFPNRLWSPAVRLPSVDRIWCLGDYSETPGRLVRLAKYGRHHHAAAILSIRLSEALLHTPAEMDEIVPVPQSPLSTIQRGFSLTEQLAKRLSFTQATPLRHHLRRRSGPRLASQVSKRRRSLIAMSQFHSSSAHVARRILLVDDVLTTGATAETCATILRERGALKVTLLAASSPLM